MNFDFDDQQIELHATVARALGDVLPFDGLEARGQDDSAGWAAMADMGLFGLLVPEDQGGLGLSLMDLALIAEEFGARLAPLSIVDTIAASDVIARHASPAQQAQWLPRLAEGGLRVSMAWHEANAGYDPARMATTLTGGTLSGEKILVTQAAKADFLLVPFRHADGARTGLAMMATGSEGVSIKPSDSLDTASGHCSIAFSGVAVPASAILEGPAPQDAADRLFDVMAALQAAMALGLASELVTRSANYARERVQFDKPIGSFQAIKHMCANMYTQVEAARAASVYAMGALAEAAPDGPRAASMAKAFCADTAVRCCHDSIQVHGGMGFTWDMGLHHFLRRARLIAATFGDGDYHRERVMAATLAALGPAAAVEARSAA